MKFKVLGLIFLIFLIAAVVSVVYYWQTNQQLANYFLENFILREPKRHSALNTFQDQELTFEIQYPTTYTAKLDAMAPNFFTKNGKTVGTISIPPKFFPKTNLVEATVTVAEGAGTNAADCNNYLSSANKATKLDKSEMINGNNFTKAEFTGVAAGNLYETRLFRIFHGSVCYEVSLVVHTTNISNHPAGDVTEVNKGEVFSRLMQILNTFKFKDLKNSENDSEQITGTLEGHVTMTIASQDDYDLTEIVVYSSDRATLVGRTNPDYSGNYSLTLPVGSYYVTYHRIDSVFQPPMTKIVITPDATTTKDFSIDNN